MRIGSVGYSTEQGLGHLMRWFYEAGVVTDVLIYRHPHGEARAPTHTEWYPPGTPVLGKPPFAGPDVDRFLDTVQVCLFLETPHDWTFVRRCRERGVKTALMPMYEWHLERPPERFDLYLNPSLLDQQYFPHGTYIPIPVPPGIKWHLRTTARRFLHNSGHIGCRNHKGTEELLKALPMVRSPIELTVRTQEPALLRRLVRSVPGLVSDTRLRVEVNNRYDDLFGPAHDVYIAPEKFNGCSLPLTEAFASGMMVMTTDRFPMNQWLPKGPLIPVARTQRARTQPGHLEFDECIVEPQTIAAMIDLWYGKNIAAFSEQGGAFAVEHSWERLGPRYRAALEGLCASP